MEQDRIWTLMARKMAGEATAKELQELELLLENSPELQETLRLLLQQPAHSSLQDEETARAFAKHLHRMQLRQQPAKAPKKPARSRYSAPTPSTWMIEFAMLRNYFKTAWRSLSRHRSFSLINIAGLAIGIAGAMLILLWIQNQLSHNDFFSKKDRIYRVLNRFDYNGEKPVWFSQPASLAASLKADYPQVEDVTRSNWVAAFLLTAGEKRFLAEEGYFADPNFFNLFDFPFVRGNAQTALATKRSIVLTENMAKRMFGDEDPIGKPVKIDTSDLFTVSAILKDLPNNTSFHFSYIVPMSYMKEVGWDNDGWNHNIDNTFVLLKPGVSEEAANKLFAGVIRAHKDEPSSEVFLHPLRKWWLWSRFENGQAVGGQIEVVRLMGLIAGFILLIACINYMNMSTARSEKRGREVGIRKVIGAGRRSLIAQFLGESILITALAAIIATIIVQLSLPWFNQLVEKNLVVPYANPFFWLLLLALIVFTGIIAGSYPAFYLSAFRPIGVLKGVFKSAHALITPRKVLVVFQFTIAIVLIISTIVVYRQIGYAQERDPGYNRNNLLFTYIKGDIQKNYPLIKNALLKSGAVTNITRTNSPITFIWRWDNSFEWPGKNTTGKLDMVSICTDKDFIKTMGLQLVDGRDIDIEQYLMDSASVLLNETAVKKMGLKQPVVGQTITNMHHHWTIVGVVKDFIPGSPYDAINPMVIKGPSSYDWFGTITFSLDPHQSTADNLKKMEAVFAEYNPTFPFEYYFADEMYAYKFAEEQRTGKLAALFAGLTIVISCLGLFALTAYMAESRIKEIGVRKVLGASVPDLAALLSKDFLKLVMIAFVIASPIAWWIMYQWLQHYSYRIALSWWIFGITGVISLLLAVITVSYQAIRAALENPVRSLRNE